MERILSYADGKECFLYLPDDFTPGKEYRLMLHFHGRTDSSEATGGNLAGPEFALFRQLCAERNWVIAVPVLNSSWFNAEKENDVERMLPALEKELQIPVARHYVLGCSMGGLAALVYAGRHPERVIRLCDIFGVADIIAQSETWYKANIARAYGGTYEEIPAFYESRRGLHYVDTLSSIPTLIIHGQDDAQVDIAQSRALYAAMKQAGASDVTFHEVPGCGHSNAIISGLENMVLDFFG